MIPLVDLVPHYAPYQSALTKAFRRILKHGKFAGGPEVEHFENAFASYIGTKYCVGVGSGTDALTFALLAIHITHKDEVILPAFTFVSTAFAVIAAGGTPVIADVDPVTLTLDPQCVARALTKRTRAIIPVHLYGMPASMDDINRIARGRNIAVIEDAAQAHGSVYRKKRAGSIGTVGCFSFYPAKNLGALGDAGAIVTNEKTIAEKIRQYGNVGRNAAHQHANIGTTSRLDSIHAAVLHEMLPHVDTWNNKRVHLALLYTKELQGLPVTTPPIRPDRQSNYHLYVIRTKRRNALQAYLKKHGIATGIHYPSPIHLEPALKFLGYTRGQFPVSEKAATEVLSLPIYPELSPHDVKKITGHIRKFFISP